MVLFKSFSPLLFLKEENIYIPIWFYSNHPVCRTCEADEPFTFQYGSIQMQTGDVVNVEDGLYIPIWFYSN